SQNKNKAKLDQVCPVASPTRDIKVTATPVVSAGSSHGHRPGNGRCGATRAWAGGRAATWNREVAGRFAARCHLDMLCALLSPQCLSNPLA
ncbi:MAG: hypothetical protein ACPIOQ_25345, partial [Promethearchaeia archaeon]